MGMTISTVEVLTRRPAADPLGQSLEQHFEQYIKYLKNKKFEGSCIEHRTYWQNRYVRSIFESELFVLLKMWHGIVSFWHI